ncbi:NAD(P)H-dependent oxidoreductase [Sphingomonas sp. RB3P16]|uniref:NADPH-dependent FMN reductase n=1 Tax=Parasphingomonas frigoris TaxID=3096163 RepID=UPI002FCB0100
MTPVSAGKIPKIVGFGGTTRPGSSGERVVRAVLAECSVMGADTHMFGGDELAQLPHFAPENDQRTAAQTAFVDAIRGCDGIVIGTPGYHGGVSGLVKNAIDLLEDLNRDERVYFDGRAVGLVVTAAGWQACGVTLQALRGIVHAMRGWPTPVGLAINTVEQKPFDADGRVVDPGLKQQIALQARQILFLAGASAGPAVTAAVA